MNNKKIILAFVFSGAAFFLLLLVGAAHRQGWFAPHDTFYVNFPSGEGIRVGTNVSISGLKAGQVTGVELGKDDEVKATLRIQSKFAKFLHEGATATLGRPFIIGERAISLSKGDRSAPKLKPSSYIPGEESLEITDLLSGGRIAPYFKTFTKLLEQLQVVIEGDGSEDSVNLVTLYKQAYRSLNALEGLTEDVHIIRRDVLATDDSKALIRQLARSTRNLEELMGHTNDAMPAMTNMSQDLNKLMPQLTKTMEETVFTLQALQRSFLLRGATKDLLEEQEKLRQPAYEKEKKRNFNQNP